MRALTKVAAVLWCLLVCLFAIPSGAQMSPFLNQFDNTLNGDDMNAIMAAGQRLYGRADVADGASDTWANPKTGNRGTITVLQSFTHEGMTCRRVRYDNRVAGLANTRSYTLNWCKTPAGEWKIA